MLGESGDRSRVGRHDLAGGVVETASPVISGIGTVPIDAAKVVDDVATGDHHHAAVA